MWGKIPEYVGQSESIIILGRSHFLFLHRRSAHGSTDLYHQLYTGCGVSISQPLRSDYNLYRLQTLQSGTTTICRIEPSILLYSKSTGSSFSHSARGFSNCTLMTIGSHRKECHVQPCSTMATSAQILITIPQPCV